MVEIPPPPPLLQEALRSGIGIGASGSDDENLEDTSSKPNGDYQTLFWMPKMLETADHNEDILKEMIGMIDAFYEAEGDSYSLRDSLAAGSVMERRDQILGELSDNEVVGTRLEVIPKDESTKFAIMGILKRHFLFSQLQDYELDDVIDAMQESFADEGDEIVTQYDEGDMLYVLTEGKCEIIIDDNVVGEITEGCFGDLALMYNSPRNATVRALSECTLWTLDRVFFRRAMVTSSAKQNETLTTFLAGIKLFDDLSSESRSKMATSFSKVSYKAGDYIIRQGEIGEHLFLLFSGEVACTKTIDDGTEVELIKLSSGEVFGERALIKQEERGANVVATTSAEVLMISRTDCSAILEEVVAKMNEIYEFRLLRSAPIFRLLTDTRLSMLAKLFEGIKLYRGQKIMCDPDTLYVVTEGMIVSTNGQTFGPSKVIGTVDEGSGEFGHITPKTDEALVKSIGREMLMIALNEPQVEKSSEIEKPAKAKKKGANKVTQRNVRMSSKLGPYGETLLQDITVLSPLGAGTFGQVYTAQHKVTGTLIALKTLDKEALKKNKQQEYVLREAHSLQSLEHPYICDYYGVIMSPKRIFFMLEYLDCGELWYLLYRNPTRPVGPYGGLPVEWVSKYVAMIVLALEHMHRHGIAYRDLKPENLLLNRTGHIKLVDFGFCKHIPFLSKSGVSQYRTYTLCGTPDYIAPEVILTQGHDKSVDYWSLGIMVYEMLSRRTPFSARSQRIMFERIVHSNKFLRFPQPFDAHAKSLVRRMLHPNPALRFGNGNDGIDSIKKHAFFSINDVNWTDVENLTFEVPYVPEAVEPQINLEPLDLESEADINIDDLDEQDPTFANIILSPLSVHDYDDMDDD